MDQRRRARRRRALELHVRELEGELFGASGEAERALQEELRQALTELGALLRP
ncbi:MAG: hypothetical protein H6828_11350 [Planctomycetes bacterium]|nr:hypothetical protein [Planctomycetota bacterium]